MIDGLIYWAPVFGTLGCLCVLVVIDWRYRQLVELATEIKLQSAVVARRSEDLVVASTLMASGNHSDAVELLRRWEDVGG